MSVVNSTPLLAAAGGEYQIERSLRFRSSASAYLNRTPGTAGNRKTWTWSGWVKRGALGSVQVLFSAGPSDSVSPFETVFRFLSTDQLSLVINGNAGIGGSAVTSAVFRDPSAWYHIVAYVDMSASGQANKARIYVNGVLQTVTYSNFGTTDDTQANNSVVHRIGVNSYALSSYLDGYLTEVNFIDGQALTPSSFGETDAVTGVWKPKKYAGTYGTNGFYLNFSDNSAATATAIGKDMSGNANNWTPNNISVTAGVTYDSMIDVPTPYDDGGNGRGNYCTLNAADTARTLSAGNLQYAGAAIGIAKATQAVSSGKWYWEYQYNGGATGGLTGIARAELNPQSVWLGQNSSGFGYFGGNGSKYNGSGGVAYGASWTTTDILGVALDMDAGTLTFYKNNTSQGVAFTGLSGLFVPAAGNSTTDDAGIFNFGQRPFAYTPPTGFKALNTQNLPEPTVVDGGEYFNAVLYTGTGSTRSVSGVGFQPDFVWVKSRSSANWHNLADAVRGTGRRLFSNSTSAEDASAGLISSFDSDGFTVGNEADYNLNGASFVAWNWKANGAGVSNTDGSITSTVSANTTAGFSVVTYTGTGAAATVGHGLGVAPGMVIVKRRDSSGSWNVYHASTGNTGAMYLELTNAFATDSTRWNNTSPTSSVFTVGSGAGVNASGGTMVAYCFAPVAGYSAFGSYTGNGSADGPFVYLGFRPAFVIQKRVAATGDNWIMSDSKRGSFNFIDEFLNSNRSEAESNNNITTGIDYLSNGFKLRSTDGSVNASGGTYIFAAFAENPFKNALAR